jgi:hypothetical protein
MNVDRLIGFAMRFLMRKGMKHFAKGQPNDPRLKNAKQIARLGRRINRP